MGPRLQRGCVWLWTCVLCNTLVRACDYSGPPERCSVPLPSICVVHSGYKRSFGVGAALCGIALEGVWMMSLSLPFQMKLLLGRAAVCTCTHILTDVFKICSVTYTGCDCVWWVMVCEQRECLCQHCLIAYAITVFQTVCIY